MPTFLFDNVVFGPVRSRRLGVSLGINLLPVDRKFCNFDCVYCECGLNESGKGPSHLPSREEVSIALDAKLNGMLLAGEAPDVITFAGNGEPTMHPEFAEIVEDTITLRDKFFPSASISVLSNSTMLHKTKVLEALKRVDQNIMKLDSGLIATIKRLNNPTGNYDVNKIIEQLQSFQGNLIVQTMFTRGNVNGELIDNTSQEDLNSLEDALRSIKPGRLMIYTIDRDTPYQGLQKISKEELKEIAQRFERLGIEVQVSA